MLIIQGQQFHIAASPQPKNVLNQDFHKIYKITEIFLLLNPANFENLNKITVQDKKHRELFTRYSYATTFYITTPMKHLQTFTLISAAFLMTFLVGCSSSRYIDTEHIEGIVTLDGNPIGGVSITFIPIDGGDDAYAFTSDDGSYRVGTLRGRIDAGTTPGEYIVTFSKYENHPTGRQSRDGEEIMREVSILHANYETKERSPWRVTVVKGRNNFDFALRSDGSGPSQ